MSAPTSTLTPTDRRDAAPLLRPLALPTILGGGLLAGVLDAADALIAFGLLGSNPVQVYQFVASGVLGAAAFQGGLSTAALGLAIHFGIAFTIATVFYVGARLVPVSLRRPVPVGLAYGALCYFVMSGVVLPLSAVPRSPFSLPLFFNGVLGHALFVGLPIAWLARRSAVQGTWHVKR